MGAETLIATPTMKADVIPAATATVVPIPATSIEALIIQYDWPDDVALAIAWCESSHNPNAYNPQPVFLNGVEHHAMGIFQTLMPLHAWRYEGASPYDPAANIRVAYGMWLESGWNPWKECW